MFYALSAIFQPSHDTEKKNVEEMCLKRLSKKKERIWPFIVVLTPVRISDPTICYAIEILDNSVSFLVT